MEEEFDLSWTNDIVQELQSENCPACEPMKQILVYHIFINGEDEAFAQKKEIIDLEESEKGSFISESKILGMIQANKKGKDKNQRFGFEDMETFGIQMDSSLLPQFLEDSEPFIQKQKYSIPQNIYIPNSLFVFHDYHYLVLYYREMEKIVSPISILKKENKKKKHTKKVRISSILPSRYGIAQNKTKKHGTRKEVL